MLPLRWQERYVYFEEDKEIVVLILVEEFWSSRDVRLGSATAGKLLGGWDGDVKPRIPTPTSASPFLIARINSTGSYASINVVIPFMAVPQVTHFS